MIQIDIDPKLPTPTQQNPSHLLSSAPISSSAEREAEQDQAGVSPDAMLFVSPPPVPLPRVLPGL